MPKLSVVVENYCLATYELSPRTQRWYAEKLEDFAAWCEAQGVGLEHLTPDHYRRYIALLRTRKNRYGKPLSSYTLHGYAQVIKGFLNWCVRERHYGVDRDFFANIKLPRVDQKIIQVFTHDQLRRMVLATRKEMTKTLWMRDEAILRVLVSTGVRASELCGMTLEDVSFSPTDAHIRVMGKGRKEREVPLGREARVSLHRYIQVYRRAPREERHVWITHRNNVLDPDGLDRVIRRLAQWGGVSGVRVSAHTFRHTFAQEFLKKTGDLYRLSRLMGHSSVAVTEIYLKAVTARDARAGVSLFDDL
jgi:site-specific recombinase XerD